MHYIDCYKKIYLYSNRGFFQRLKLIKNINKLIKHEESNVDFLRYWINEFEKQMNKWEVDNDGSYSEVINTYSHIVNVHKLSGRLSMINLDVLIAMKYLVYAKSDIECRFFARRIFTLIYETRKGYLGDLGLLIRNINELDYIHNLQAYKDIHKKLSRYISEHENILKDTRNTNEAHKDKDFEKQVASIENFNIEKAFEIIIEYYYLLIQCSDLNVILQQELGRYVNQILNDMINEQKSQLDIIKRKIGTNVFNVKI